MKIDRIKIRIGMRTLKTTIAVILAMFVVELLGTTASKLIFAMLGAMAAVQPTFKESIEACLSQIIGVVFGAIVGVLLSIFPLPALVATGIGIILTISLYNGLRIRYSPSLPCFILVMICTSPEIQPFAYAIGRIWDTAIGLGIGLLINMLIFPYDNSRQIRASADSLDNELLVFLEDMFDGDDKLPTAEKTLALNATMQNQLKIYADQKLPMRIRRQQEELERFRQCEKYTGILLAHMEILCSLDSLGRLTEENRQALLDCGARINDTRIIDTPTDIDIITNYHLSCILQIRNSLLDILNT